MKLHKFLSYLAIGAGAVFAMTSCSDDNGSNPTVIAPTSFQLFQPEVGSATVDLKSDDPNYGIIMTWNQPKYTDNGAPLGYNAGAGTSYRVKVSLNGRFTNAFKSDSVDGKTGKYIGSTFDYVVLPDVYPTTTSNVLATAINKALNQLNQFNASEDEKWTEDVDIDPVDMVVMVESDVSNGDYNLYSINSNTIKLSVKPFYVEPASKDGVTYYFLTGNPNAWSTEMSIPMFPSVDDSKTQSCTAYFWSEYDLKIWTMENVGTWDNAVGAENGTKEESGKLITSDAGAIASPEADYYTFTINLNTMTYQWTKYEKAVADYSLISIIGVNGEWGVDYDMTQAYSNEKYGNRASHIWWAKNVKITSACEVKFRVDHAWDTSWGNSETFPYGTASSGDNIKNVTPGTYNVYFNDITKEYSFVPVE